jgi:hypothetical protein
MGNDVSLLDKWYRTDFNSVPPVSILQPIDTYLVHFLNKRVPKLQARDSGIWWGTLAKMQLMLRKASHTLYVNGKMNHEEMHNYHMAVTEREVINGCLSVENVKVGISGFSRSALIQHIGHSKLHTRIPGRKGYSYQNKAFFHNSN